MQTIDGGEQFARRALRKNPADIDALTQLARLRLQQGNLDESARLLRRALNQRPNAAALHASLGNVFWLMKRAEEAIARYQRAIALKPDFADAWHNLGRVLEASQGAAEAMSSYEKAIALRPDYPEALNNLGNALLSLGRSREAVERFEQALKSRPNYPAALNNLANALRVERRTEGAIERYRQVLAIQPDLVEALDNLGCALQFIGRPAEAVPYLERAVALRPEYSHARLNLAVALVESGRHQDALEHLQTVLAQTPEDPEAHTKLGDTLVELGRFDEAHKAFERALSLAPDHAGAHLNLALSKHFDADPADDQRLAALRDLLKRRDVPDADRLRFHFALGKAYSDLGKDTVSLEHFIAGNELMRSNLRYDEAETMREFERSRRVFTREFLASRSEGGHPSAVPLFVVGMPRSGTTLVEQIIASHPKVFGGGEFSDLELIVGDLRGKRQSYLDVIPEMTPRDFHRLGEEYLARISRGHEDAPHITDKMPLNFRYLGLISMALPKARVIHVTRDPIDTCVSCFTKLFGGNLPFAYDLAELGRYYREYERLMAHWQDVLPRKPLLVCYEDLVDDLETHARRIVDYCGLEWDDRCLAFYETKRAVRTASVAQVRQPIYRSAIGRWRAHTEVLHPLIEALGAKTGGAQS